MWKTFRALLAEFKSSIKHGTALQAPLALLGFVLGVMTCGIAVTGDGSPVRSRSSAWPWTLFIIRPINSELLNTDLANAGPHTRALIVRWGLLHLGRVTLGIAATLLFLLANIQ